MSVAPVPGSRGSGQSHRLGWWLVRMSALSGVAFATGLGAVALAYAIGEEDAVEDTALALALAAIAFAGLLGAAVAFVIAIVMVVRTGARQLLREGALLGWLPLCVFPAIAVVLVLGEAFLWE